MSLTAKLKKIYHVVVRRDVLGPIGTSKFGEVGQRATIYRPEVLDRNTKNVFVGEGTTILAHSRIQLYPTDGVLPRITFGKDCYISYHNTFLAGGNITLGDGVLMASNILVSSENHSTDPEAGAYYMDQPIKCADVSIGDGTWLGERAMVMAGVHIGKWCVIGGGSIVTHDVPDYSIAVGSPARVIKTYDFERHEWVRASH